MRAWLRTFFLFFMKILIAETVLAEGLQKAQPAENVQIESQRQVQTAHTIRGAHAQLYERGNQSVCIRFEVTRCHLSRAEAEAFALEHSAELKNLHGALRLEVSQEKQFSMKEAWVRKLVCKPEGLKTRHFYEIVGKALHS